MVFDAETTVDAAQQLRFGPYRLYKGTELRDTGLFCDPKTLNEAETSVLTRYAARHRMTLLTVAEFVDRVFFPTVYDHVGLCIGFNLPFDLSRIAVAHSSARAQMRGGFSFQLSKDLRRPRIQVRHLNARAAMIRFTVPPGQRTPRGQRRRRIPVSVRRGHFLDVRTLAGAVLGGSWSLNALGENLGIAHPKVATDEHGSELTEAYLDYAVRDSLATWECFQALEARYASWGLTEVSVTKI